MTGEQPENGWMGWEWTGSHGRGLHPIFEAHGRPRWKGELETYDGVQANAFVQELTENLRNSIPLVP